MKIFKANDFAVCRIDFCCGNMAKDILLGVVTTRRWTDHGLLFYVRDYTLSHCGHCGAKIVGETFGETFYTNQGDET